MATTAAGTPYVEASDLVAGYPAVSLALANHIDDTSGKVLQVVSVIKVDTFSTSSTSYVDVTGLTVNITPSATSSKILVIVSLALSNNTAGVNSRGQILRGATVIGAGTAAGTRSVGSFAYGQSTGSVPTQTMNLLDAPASTSALTYKVQIASQTSGAASVGFGYSTDTNDPVVIRNAATITLMEISA
jgi:hypothetical protein